MPWARYVASESIIPIHVAGVTYTFSFRLQRADPSTELLKVEQRSLSGVKETLYFGKVRTWQIVLEPVPAIEAPLIEEFLDSIANGQVFTFDPYGSVDRPIRPIQCDREDKGHAPRRAVETGDPVYGDYLEYSFAINERA